MFILWNMPRFLSAQQSVASQDAYVIFLLAYDESRNEIFEFITQAENLGKKPIFLIPSSKMAFTPEEMNLEKYALIKKQHQNFRKYEHFDYDSLEDLTEKLASIAQWHKPSVCIKSLLLENIGVHEHLEINFHEKMTCLVGQNGSGKTTILRALALALVGKHPAIKKTDDLIKILGIFDDKKEGFAQENRKVIRKQGGNLALRFTVAEQPLENKVFFKQNQLDVWEMESELAYHFCSETQPADMKNLVVGFSQQRNEDEDDEPSRTNPNIWDISKLIQNQANNHLRKFEQWLIDLYAKINELFKQKTFEKQAVASLQDIAEMQIINKVFAVFSEITGQNMEFLTVWENKEVWVKISENPNGIKLKMLSQGFQSVMSWVGYFTQRMAETYFLTHKTDFYAQSAICLIDEIDTYLHPNWQANFVNALQNHFPNVQFIITTHSPLVLSALRSEQVFMVQGEIEGEILGLDATRILQEIGAEYRGGEIKISDTETVKVQEIIDELSTTVMNENWERSRELIDLLKKFNAEIPEISRFETIIKIKTRNK
ncbi:MAG: hypothetical protein EAZ97_02385 [Bacteroidetes bacterium]|nr:MAG: hypothetical protein EAZ97_02385 [Bacteroidota bacterium]